MRLSLGGMRGSVARLLFIESLILSLAGGLLGVALAGALLRVLPAVAADGVPRLADVRLDAAVLLFTLAAALATATLFGLLPALRSTREDLASVLRSAGRGASAGRERIWSGLVVAEVALALLLLVGAGLLIRSFGSILATDPGFRTHGVLLATVNPPSWKYGDQHDRARYYERLIEELRAVPGVEEVGLAAHEPLSPVPVGLVHIEGGPQPAVTGSYQVADAAYFSVLGIPLIRGRLFEAGDVREAEHVVVVNESFAALAWPGRDPIGMRMTGGGMDDLTGERRWARVIGVVADARQTALTEDPPPTYYFPLGQRPYRAWSATLAVRPRAGDAVTLTRAARAALRGVDPDVPAAFATIEQRVGDSVTDRRFTMLLLGGFAAIGLLLALVGIYGVVSYAAARRTREMGIRLALGAQPRAVRALVQRRVMKLAVTGVVLGSAAAFAATRIMASLLYEVSPADPPTFAAVALVVAGTAWVAGWVRARRSSRVDPVITMRAD